IVAAVLFFIYWIRKRRQGGPRIEAPLLSPLEELQQRVRQLESDSLLRKGEVKLHFLHLTEILKHFLSRTYRFNAEELTTYETIYDLKKHETETPVVNHMDSLFSTSDLVKFAKYIPEAETLQDVSERLDELIGIYTRRMLHVEKNEAGNAPTDTGGGLATKPDTTMLPPTTVPEEREASL
ncbi:MAG: hypothetical protein GY765_06655, partial [bacterium]|nr:hypothetical protein [bacterium]